MPRRWAGYGRWCLATTSCWAALGCAGSSPAAVDAAATGATPSTCEAAAKLVFTPDTSGLSEAYVCFGFDAGILGGASIGAVAWTPPLAGPFVLHHATLYAVPAAYPDGPIPCHGMPAGASGIDVWAPGVEALVLPSDTGLRLPAGTQRLVIEAHTLLAGSGVPRSASVTLCAGPASPTNLATVIGMSVSVPAIRPRHVETSQGTCVLSGAVHLFSVWPHMHLIGQEVSVDLLGVDSGTTSLVDVKPWNFLAQSRYPLDVDVVAGDRIQTTCVWNNTSDSYVLPGLLTENEMCTAGLIAWPAASATCTPFAP